MKVEFKFSINFKRDQPQYAYIERDVELNSMVEHAASQPIGFTANPGRTEPDEWEDE